MQRPKSRLGIGVLSILIALALPALLRAGPPAGRPPLVLNGFAAELSGDSVNYHSFHPYATTALLTRCTDGRRTISWKTDPVPVDAAGDSVTFVWIAAHSAGSGKGDASFRLALDGRELFGLTTSKSRPLRRWSLTADDGSRLSFEAKWEDPLHDLFGYLSLTLPLRGAPRGRPLTLALTGDSLNSRDWFMTFKHAFRESLAVIPQPALLRTASGGKQALEVLVDHIGSPARAEVMVPGKDPAPMPLELGFNRMQVAIDTTGAPRQIPIIVKLPGSPAREVTVTQEPVHYREFWLLPHSHNDIGYSDLQADVLKKQIRNLRDAVRLIRETAAYPEAARFRWNTEILWAVEQYLTVCSAEERREFAAAVRSDGIDLNALYANQLTGICRPEELLRLTDVARRLGKEFGVTVDDAMITDIPGYAWAIVPALAQAGIRYFSSGPNYMPGFPILGDRVGHFNTTWGDKPFYWAGPSGRDKILFWTAGKGYSWFHDWITGRAGPSTAANLFGYLRELDAQRYPYDMVQLRYTVMGDNGPVDPNLPAFVKEWNERYVSPRLVIATASGMFHEFERRWGASLPTYAGDITPYWEDGALSTLRELGIVRVVSERLVQTEALACMTGGKDRLDSPSRALLDSAWRNVALFDEHTWGAANSIAEPESPNVKAQWAVKRAYALDAGRQSAGLLASLLGSAARGDALEVLNTASWTRTSLVTLPAAGSRKGDRVVDEHGAAVPSQRLSTGELAFIARDVPPLGAKRYFLRPGKALLRGHVTVNGTAMDNGLVALTLDPSTGAIRSLKGPEGQELADGSRGGLNRYLYVAGRSPDSARGVQQARIEVIDPGPVVGRLRVTSTAPGARALVEEISLADGIPHVALADTIDKLNVLQKESVHIAFPFALSGGAWRLDAGWGVMRPPTDQLPGSCEDYLSAGRWADLSAPGWGVTLTLSESPLVELGAMTDETEIVHMLRSWRTSLPTGTTLYSYAMNNYWHTNYAASQEGPASLHYALLPHGPFSAAAAYRAGVEQSQPLLLRQAAKSVRQIRSLFSLDVADVVVSSIMPSADGKAVMVRLYNAGETPASCRIRWGSLRPKKVWLSSLKEGADAPAGGRLSLPPFGIQTLRCDL